MRKLSRSASDKLNSHSLLRCLVQIQDADIVGSATVADGGGECGFEEGLVVNLVCSDGEEDVVGDGDGCGGKSCCCCGGSGRR